MKKLTALERAAVILVIIGGINWGLLTLFNYNLVNSVLGGVNIVSKIVYTLVGLSAVYLALILMKLTKK